MKKKQTLAERIVAANEELLEQGELDALETTFAPDYVLHLVDRDRHGLRPIQRFVKDLRKAFADLRVEVEVLATQADRVAWQRTLRARHRAGFQGFPASGRAIRWRDMIVSRFEDGRIAEEWAVSDLAERLLRARGSTRGSRARAPR